MTVQPHARKAVEAHHLDQPVDLRLGPLQIDGTAPPAQAAGEQRQVEHQRGIGEHQLAEVDQDIALGRDRTGDRLASNSLRSAVFVPGAAQDGGFFIEVDDARNATQMSRQLSARPPAFRTLCTCRLSKMSLMHCAM